MIEILRALGATQSNAEKFAEPIEAAMEEFGIDTPAQQAAFLAQTGHESMRFSTTHELWGPTEAQKKYDTRKDLGNSEPGDGFKYRGMGLIQTTGKTNQFRVADYFNISHDDIGTWLQTPEGASRSAGLFWKDNGCNSYVDVNDFKGLTRRINGGLNGFEERQVLWEKAKASLGVQ